jgi:hypothetical protein
MAVNKFKNPKKKAEKATKPALFRFLDKFSTLDSMFENGLPVKYIPKLLFLTLLGIIYIANSHYSDKNIRRYDKIKAEVEDLRVDYTTLKADYMLASKQSEVAKKVAPQGLQESSVPPVKIIIKESEY